MRDHRSARVDEPKTFAVKIVALYPKLAATPLSSVHQALIDLAGRYAEGVAKRGHIFVIDLKRNMLWSAADEERRTHKLCLECGHWVGARIVRTHVHNPAGAVNGVAIARFCANHPTGMPEAAVQQ